MKIIVNAVGYVGQSGGAGGAGVFLRYLIDQLARQHSVDVLVAQNSRSFPTRPRNARFIEVPYLEGETLRHLRNGPTVVLDPFGGLPCAAFPHDMALCVVVHDLMHLERPHFFTASERDGRSRGFAAGLQRADEIITFSEDQARAIRAFYPGTNPTVIAHLPYAILTDAVDGDAAPDVSEFGDFVFFPAVKWPHKNHRTAIEAFGAYVRRTGSKLRLVMCGGGCAESRFSFYPAAEQISDRIADLGLVDDAQVRALLRGARAILFPTLYEGFGIPVLEAACAGKMVIASRLDVFDEILGQDGYRGVDEPLCQLRWMDAFADAEGEKRLHYEARAARVREGVSVARFADQVSATLQQAADRYTHPARYPSRAFRNHDRLATTAVLALSFADLHATATRERGARHPVLGANPAARHSTIFRAAAAPGDRRVCLRADFDAGAAAPGQAPGALFSAWIRLPGEPNVDQLCWSVNDGDVVDILADIADGEWHLFRRAVPRAGFVDFRARRGAASDVAGFDLEIHDPCLLEVAPLEVPAGAPPPRGLTIALDCVTAPFVLANIVADVARVNDALGFACARLRWVLIAADAVLGAARSDSLPANVRVLVVPGATFDRADAARMLSPYEPVDQVLLLSAHDVAACLAKDNLDILAACLGPARAAMGARLAELAALLTVWLDEERGCIFDASARVGQPVPLLDQAVVRASLRVPATRARRRFAIIETDLIGGISHHSAVTGLFLDGAALCGCDPLLGLNKAATAVADTDVENWAGFHTQVYDPGRADEFLQDLAAFVRATRLGPADIIFMHSLSPQILLGAARYVAAHPQNAPRFALRLFSTAEAMAGHKLSYTKILKSILSVGVVRARMHFFCESRNLIEYYKDATGIAFPLLLNPEHPALQLVRSSNWYDAALGGGKRRTLAYFGEARAEKGFDLIPGIIEALLADPDMASFHFNIQVGSNSLNQTPDMARAKAALMALKARHPDRIRTFDAAATPEEFYFLMKHATAVIAPYRAQSYGTRGSGVTLEALQMGLDIFAWQDTDLYATFGDTGHVIGVPPGADFAAAIARHYAAPPAAARAGVAALRQTPAEVCQRLLALCQDAPQDSLPAQAPLLWVGNDTFGEGCSAVYAAQKRALRENGRDFLELFVPWPDHSLRAAPPAAVDAKLYGFDSLYDSQGLAWVARPRFGAELDRILQGIEKNGPSYTRLRDLNRHIAMPDSLRQAIAANHITRTVLNYAHLHPVIAAAMPIDGIVCETHDVMSYQHAVRRGTAVSLTEKIDEFSDLAQFRQIIAISASEWREMASACPASDVFWRLPPYVAERVPVAAGQLPRDAEQLAAICRATPQIEAIARPSPVMLGVYRSRSDLQKEFELGSLVGRLAYVRWWVFFGQFEYPDQFGLSRAQVKWLVGDAAAATPTPNGLEQFMLSVRPDLRAVFVKRRGVDALKLRRWAERDGAHEYGVSAAQLQAACERHFGAAPETEDAAVLPALDAVMAAQPLGKKEAAAEQQALFERIQAIGTIDLVLIGSLHPGNVASFEWFLKEVYLPLLAPSGHSLFIAGSVGSRLRHVSHRNLVILGRCTFIEPLLQAARACPLPVIAGSGSPIKTIPALAANGAVTVTEHVERAFGLSEFGIPAFSEPGRFAEDIRLLLGDASRRAARVQAARRYVDANLTESGYVAFWRERLNAKEERLLF